MMMNYNLLMPHQVANYNRRGFANVSVKRAIGAASKRRSAMAPARVSVAGRTTLFAMQSQWPSLPSPSASTGE